MLQGEHSAILSTFIKLPFVIFILSIFECPLKTDEAQEGFLGIQGYWAKTERDTGYNCKYLKGYRILGSILGI